VNTSISSEPAYDADYYERGLAVGKSCYQDYRWLPELTIPMAHYIVTSLGLRHGDTVLDYGCAKGYLVRALRLLGIEAFGCDVSPYAIENAHPEIYSKCWLLQSELFPPFKTVYDWCISKDVLEHMDRESLELFLQQARKRAARAFHVIPLGDKGIYRIPEYERDVTHRTAENEEYWLEIFESCGWRLESFSWSMTGVKEKWTEQYQKGNGFFILK
jgi:cyclopropane fatty-acyl-phospholipid synthase-like methyltransferase